MYENILHELKNIQRELDILKAFDVPLGTLGTWHAYTPTWTMTGGAPTLGNGTLTGRYTQVGKLVVTSINFVWGASTSLTGTTWRFTLPVPDANHAYDTGSAWMLDVSTGALQAGACLVSPGNSFLQMYGYNSAVSGAAAPFAWAVGDLLSVKIAYEAA